MASLRLGGSLASVFLSDVSEWKPGRINCKPFNLSSGFLTRRGDGWGGGDARCLRLYPTKHGRPSPVSSTVGERRSFSSIRSHACSNCSAEAYHEGERSASNEVGLLGSFKEAIYELVGNPIRGPHARSVTSDLTALALPAIVGQAVNQ